MLVKQCLPDQPTLSLLGATGDGMGRVILGGGALFGVGSLCFYGLGLSGETGAIDRAGYAQDLQCHALCSHSNIFVCPVWYTLC